LVQLPHRDRVAGADPSLWWENTPQAGLGRLIFQTADENRERQQEADASGRRVLASTRAGGVDPTQALRATVQDLWAGQVSENSISRRVFERYQVGLGSMLL
jgi:hypothetical protein